MGRGLFWRWKWLDELKIWPRLLSLFSHKSLRISHCYGQNNSSDCTSSPWLCDSLREGKIGIENRVRLELSTMTQKTLPTPDATLATHSIVTGIYLFFIANANSFKYDKDEENTEVRISMLNGNLIVYMSLGIRLSR